MFASWPSDPATAKNLLGLSSSVAFGCWAWLTVQLGPTYAAELAGEQSTNTLASASGAASAAKPTPAKPAAPVNPAASEQPAAPIRLAAATKPAAPMKPEAGAVPPTAPSAASTTTPAASAGNPTGPTTPATAGSAATPAPAPGQVSHPPTPTPEPDVQPAGNDAAAESTPMTVVNFAFDDASVGKRGCRQLASVARKLRDRAAARVTLRGHTDSVGESAYNETLSRERAESVKKCLISLGASSQQIHVESLGSSQPVDTGQPDANRRVELIWNP